MSMLLTAFRHNMIHVYLNLTLNRVINIAQNLKTLEYPQFIERGVGRKINLIDTRRSYWNSSII